jgi:hypothetical protein
MRDFLKSSKVCWVHKQIVDANVILTNVLSVQVDANVIIIIIIIMS